MHLTRVTLSVCSIALMSTLAACSSDKAASTTTRNVEDTADAADTGGGIIDVPGGGDSAADGDDDSAGSSDAPVFAPDPGEFGAACTENSECLTGWCVSSSLGPVCTRTCVDECPNGWSCVGITGETDVTFLCVPRGDRLCEPCTVDTQCGSGYCLEMEEGQRCTAGCDDDEDCPAGYGCELAASEVTTDRESKQCIPKHDSCDCLPGTEGLQRPCNNKNDAGTCWGLETCQGADGWSACDAPVPAAEVCDGVDNNCNLFTDENLVDDTPCETSNTFGTCVGRRVCEGDAGFVCVAPEAAPETCNFSDDDCDGAVDEDFADPITGVYATDQNCGVCGNDCTGLFPNAVSVCEAAAGEARCVVASCAPGYYKAGPSTCLPIVETACAPCTEDANCVVPGNACVALEDSGGSVCAEDCAAGNLSGRPAGQCDPGFTCKTLEGTERRVCLPTTNSCDCRGASDAGETRACTRTNDFGTCGGAQTCGATGFSQCSARVPAAETCNGQDDDCDGVADEEIAEPEAACEKKNSQGTCGGDWNCNGAGGWVCNALTPAAETCNGRDDDCDGLTDESFKNEAGLYVSDDHCGVCNRSCDSVVLFASATECRVDDGVAVCVATSCDPGFYIPPDTDRVCVPSSGAKACSPCADDAQCSELRDGKCQLVDGAKFCTSGCTGNSDCASGYTCSLAAGATEGRCLPKSQSCTCLTANAGDLRACANSNSDGTCTGVSTCNPNAAPGWSACSARVPGGETCNGQDDNCDGRIDESVVHDPPTCTSENGNGVCTNTWRCDPVAGWVCPVEAPAAEKCNFADDNCDGKIDEGFKQSSGRYVSDDHCGNCNSSCNDLIPNATAHCVDSGGRAHCEVLECESGYYRAGPLTCLPVSDVACVPCASDDNCPTPGDRCLDLDGGKYCGRDCSEGNLHGEAAGACDTGYECKAITALGSGVMQCVPTSGSCTCMDADDRGDLRTCTVANDSGTCFGNQTCGATGWSACSAETPATEECNGVDDDCDGRVDEEVAVPNNACAETVEDVGTCTGAWLCSGESGWVCNAATPKVEVCNGVDDDCDGVADQAFRDLASGIYDDFDHCGACGISCDAAIPNATAQCKVRDGTARCEVDTCANGFYQAGTTTCLPATDSRCVPCVTDANCPTPGDLCLELDGGRFCGRDCSAGNKHGLAAGECGDDYECATIAAAGDAQQCVPLSRSCSCLDDDRDDVRSCTATNELGTCGGTEVCVPEDGWGGCTARTPVAEECNGVDDDCDGRLDEEVPTPNQPCAKTVGANTCTAPWVCAGAWVCNAQTPKDELCNGLDDDCDGGTDETFKVGDLYATNTSCGACGISCDGMIPSSTEACVVTDGVARCEVESCDVGFYAASDLTCLPASDNTCVPCLTDDNCPTPGDRCLDLDGGKYCGRDCADGNAHGFEAGLCEDGYTCKTMNDLGAGVRQCVPESGSCTCVGTDQGDTRTCKVQNELGTCFGGETCEIDKGWVECSAKTPKAEECNGVDDDCDGLVDEGVVAPSAPCRQVNEHGTCSATWRCAGEWKCDAALPAAEVCDAADNDCSGGIDEPFKNAQGKYIDDDNCGACGVSCDGAIPNATAVCAIGPSGNPRCEVGDCDNGYFESGPLSCTAVEDKVCLPCDDDGDCGAPGDRCVETDDGRVCGKDCSADNLHGTLAGDCVSGFECLAIEGGHDQCVPKSGTCSCLPVNFGATRACQSTSGDGTCFGLEVCDPDEGWVDCSADDPQGEMCNGVDDNCNGLVDEQLAHDPLTCDKTVVGVGTCTAPWVCAGAGQWQCNPKTPTAELCNFADDDCDSATDEAFKDGQGRYVDDANCGSCGVSCAGAIPNATATCRVSGSTPRCEVLTCQTGYYQAGPLTCLPATDNTCAPCANDSNCRTPGDKCLDLDGAKVCGRDCSAGNVYGTTSCPSGNYCKDFGADVKQCVPLSNSCTCVAGDSGDLRACQKQNGIGTCRGQEVCDPAVGWGACSAATPSDETCNGGDDDCDFVVDDVSGRGATCDITTPGVGTCHGVRDCVSGQGAALVCVGQTPATEKCNYGDDDCDGTTDEGFAQLNQSCSEGTGACRRFGFHVCTSNGAGTQCNAVAGSASAELCDSIDNDCDTFTDEESAFALKGTPCTPGVGVCQRTGVYQCSGDGLGVACSVSAGSPTTETCNNLDDDCNSVVDNGFNKGQVCSVGLGVCKAFGNYACDANGLGTHCDATAGASSTEVCDLLDNDCNGATDNGFVDGNGRYVQTTACGNCFTNCTAIFAGRSHAFGQCDTQPTTPACKMGCDATFFDLNAVPGDGCEFGLDATAIYVGTASSGATDTGACGLGPVGTGDLNFPCKTIARGLARAVALSRTKVIVSDGLYQEQVTLVSGISLLGGYRADNWERHLTSTTTTIRGATPAGQTHKKTIVATNITATTLLEGFVIYGESNFASGGNSYAVYIANSTSALTLNRNFVFGGFGGDGDLGDAGDAGDGGGNGQNGSGAVSTDEWSQAQCLLVSGIPGNGGTAGDGGANTCTAGTPTGGAGAGSTCPNLNAQQAQGTAGSRAGDAATGNAGGGTGGLGGNDWASPHNTSCGTFNTGGFTHDGKNGDAGGDGNFGDAGGGCSVGSAGGSVSGLEWLGADGAAGGAGKDGGGGGGGGAGGGADIVTSNCAQQISGSTNDSAGGSGGGGGAGGCGGELGAGGKSGGGAFAIFVVFGSPSASLPVLTYNTITPGTGGNGGDGGLGGAGGLGGHGGSGGATSGAFSSIMGPGGRGGEGGDGGHGGGGGGGCGGVSYSLFVSGNSVTPNWHLAAQNNTFVVGGGGGFGGDGGSSLGNTGGDGADGSAGDRNY